jgi:NitT/TauT family transport system substrate-binding protein
MNKALGPLLLALSPLLTQASEGGENVRFGTLTFGTVSWELAAIRNEGLDKKYGVVVQEQVLAGPDAGKIGLKAGSLDLIATDWIWVANQRSTGADYRFIPYSTHAGALIARGDGGIRTLADLEGKKLGVVGGPLDKNWVLLRTYARDQAGIDLEHSAETVFGAPPLLSREMADGKLDALLTFWNHAAKLEKQGFRRILDGRDLVRGLGVKDPLANLGYVFKQSWAEKNPKALDGLLKASAEARRLLCESDAAWNKVAPLTQESDPALRATLRREYCAGIAHRWTPEDNDAAARIYTLLRTHAGDQLTGKAETLPRDIFWTGPLP